MRHVSGSALPLALKCAASQALPRIYRAGGKEKIGSALHEHFRERSVYGLDESIRRLPELATHFELDEKETGIFIARAKGFTWMPPKGAVCEVALALWDDGSVSMVKGGKGQYDLTDDARMAAQIDVFWAEPSPLYLNEVGEVVCPPESILWVADLKSGSEDYVDPIERNAQVLAATVMAAKLTGAKRATPAIIYWRKGAGVWDAPDAPLGPEQLAETEAMLLRGIERVNRQRDLYASGGQMTFVEGPWCTFCDSQIYCTAKIGALKACLDDPEPYAKDAMLTEAQLQRIAELAPAVERLAKSMKAACKAAVDARGGKPIVLKDGRDWGPNPHPKKEILPHVALPILAEVVGVERARKALKIELSQTAIEDAVRDAHEEQGIQRKLGPTVRGIMAKTIEAGGLEYGTEIWYSAHRPIPTLVEVTQHLRLPPAVDPEEIDGDD